MKLQIYRKVLKSLRDLYSKRGQELKGFFYTRLKKLAGFITGMIRHKSSHLSKIGKGLPQRITAYSKEKGAKQYIYNPHVDIETYYLPFMEDMLEGILCQPSQKNGINFIIDGSQMGNNHCALMISIAYKKRSIPILWIVKKQPKGHFSTEDHVELAQQVAKLLKPLIPQDLPVTLLGDGEFGSIDLQIFCKSMGWDYVFRIKKNTLLYESEDNDEYQETENSFGSFKPKQLQVEANHDCLFIPHLEYTKERYQWVNFLLWHDVRYDKPLPLIASLNCPLEIMAAYDKRYGIEALFKDLKSTSFNLHKTRVKDAAAISNLILIAALAFDFLTNLGEMFNDNPIKKYILRERKDRKEFSFFSFALLLLEYFIDENIDFSFYSNMSMNSG